MSATDCQCGAGVFKQVTDAIRSVRYGTVLLTIHDARVVQIERSEKIRVDTATDSTTRGQLTRPVPTDRTSGGPRLQDGR